MLTTPNNGSAAASGLPLIHFFSDRLQTFLAPLLVFLDQVLDRRLVSTFLGLCESIIRLRSRSTGLYLSELGSYLLSPDKAPAGTKRISNLWRSPNWDEGRIINYLALQTQVYCQQLLAVKQELLLLLWDESVQEKAESLKSEGLCAVRSSKAKRLLSIKPGYYDPPTKETVHVPGLRWVGLLLAGLSAHPQLARFRWWTSRKPHFLSLDQCLSRLGSCLAGLCCMSLTGAMPRKNGLDCSWLGRIGFCCVGLRLINSSMSKAEGKEPAASRWVSGLLLPNLWDMVRKCQLKRSLLWQRCWHADYADCPLTLIICRSGRKGRQPWYLLTNEEVENDQQAWKLVHAYARRWQIEQSFRFTKSELGMESCRLWFWDNRMKLLQIVALV
jgi:hypothetical protein